MKKLIDKIQKIVDAEPIDIVIYALLAIIAGAFLGISGYVLWMVL